MNKKKETTVYKKNNIQYWKVVEEFDENDVINDFKKTDIEFLNMKRKINIFADLSLTRKLTPKARKIAKESLEGDKIGKVALFGLNPVVKVIALLIAGLTDKREIRFFNSKEDAIKWLNK